MKYWVSESLRLIKLISVYIFCDATTILFLSDRWQCTYKSYQHSFTAGRSNYHIYVEYVKYADSTKNWANFGQHFM